MYTNIITNHKLTETFPANLGTLDLKADDGPVLAFVLNESYLPGPGARDYNIRRQSHHQSHQLMIWLLPLTM